MKHFFKPSKLLFYLLITLLFLFMGMVFAAVTGAAKGQGLAGGAIVLGYGVIFAGVALIVSIFIAQLIDSTLVISLNKVLLLIVGILLVYFTYRYQTSGRLFKAAQVFPTVHAASLDNNQAKATIVPIGLGMVQPDFYNNKALLFYGNPNLEKAVSDHSASEKLIFDRTETGFSIKTAPPWFVPAHLKMDYEILYMRLISVSHDFIEVMVNERTGQTAYLDRSKNKLIYWPEFLLSINSVEAISYEDNPVRIKPLDHAAKVLKPFAFLKPLKVNNGWMQVELVDDDYKSQGKGWIKWKEQDKLLITYSLLS